MMICRNEKPSSMINDNMPETAHDTNHIPPFPHIKKKDETTKAVVIIETRQKSFQGQQENEWTSPGSSRLSLSSKSPKALTIINIPHEEALGAMVLHPESKTFQKNSTSFKGIFLWNCGQFIQTTKKIIQHRKKKLFLHDRVHNRVNHISTNKPIRKLETKKLTNEE